MMPKQCMNEAIKKEWSKQCIAMDRYMPIATVLTTVPRKENEIKNTHQLRTLKLSSVIYGTDFILKYECLRCRVFCNSYQKENLNQ